MASDPPTLTLADIDAGLKRLAAIRRIRHLQPAGGMGDKVFPPTYEGGEYATEERVVAENGDLVKVETVLLDSVQSQANRLEMALLRAIGRGAVQFPLLVVDFERESEPELSEIGRISTLDAPHRVADAIFRDSDLDGTSFRKSDLGKKLDKTNPQNATPLFELCPTALVFGVWDSTGPRGGLGAKFQRALVSEIVGYGAVRGKRSSSRLDPLQIERDATIYESATEEGDWTPDETRAKKDGRGNPIKFKKDGKPSRVNHGNVTPSLKDDKSGDWLPGGFTITHAVQTTVLSLAALRRLRFPVEGKGTERQDEIDRAAQATLVALALAAILLQDLDGLDLRSRCLLDGPPAPFELVGGGETAPYSLSTEQSAALVEEAAARARDLGLPWPETLPSLKPSEKLRQLILKSRRA